MAIIGHVAIRLRLFPYEGMTVTDVIDHADEACAGSIPKDSGCGWSL
jgi:hypothetical protein